jgi:hypothetical protein
LGMGLSAYLGANVLIATWNGDAESRA